MKALFIETSFLGVNTSCGSVLTVVFSVTLNQNISSNIFTVTSILLN